MTEPMNELTISVSEFCRRTGLGRTKCFELLHLGHLERVKVGRRTLITTASIHALISSSLVRGEA